MTPRSAIFVGLTLVCVSAACASAPRRRSVMTYTEDAERAYEAAMEDYRSNNCLDAAPSFREVRREYPYSRYAALAELRLADCKFREEQFEEAITAYRAWIRFHRTHREVPYARYRIALSYVEQVPDDFFLTPASWRRDQESTHDALRQLRRFIRDYPQSSLAPRARQHMRDCLTLLARHDLYVAGFYLDRDKPRAAVLRLRAMLHAYPDSSIAPEAMMLLGRTHMQMRQRDEARDVFARLTERYPETGWARQARAYLAFLGPGPRRVAPPRRTTPATPAPPTAPEEPPTATPEEATTPEEPAEEEEEEEEEEAPSPATPSAEPTEE